MKDDSKKDIRRNNIVAEARRLFMENGVNETSVSQIAKSANIAKGLFYYYFETKEDVLKSVAQQICDEHVQDLESRLEKTDDFYCHLLALIDAYYDFYPRHKSKSELALLFENNIILFFHREFIKRTAHFNQDIINEGKRLGYFNYEEPQMMLLMSIEGLFYLNRLNFIDQSKAITLIGQSLQIDETHLKQYEYLLVNFSKESDYEEGDRTTERSGTSFRKTQAARQPNQ